MLAHVSTPWLMLRCGIIRKRLGCRWNWQQWWWWWHTQPIEQTPYISNHTRCTTMYRLYVPVPSTKHYKHSQKWHIHQRAVHRQTNRQTWQDLHCLFLLPHSPRKRCAKLHIENEQQKQKIAQNGDVKEQQKQTAKKYMKNEKSMCDNNNNNNQTINQHSFIK